MKLINIYEKKNNPVNVEDEASKLWHQYNKRNVRKKIVFYILFYFCILIIFILVIIGLYIVISPTDPLHGL